MRGIVKGRMERVSWYSHSVATAMARDFEGTVRTFFPGVLSTRLSSMRVQPSGSSRTITSLYSLGSMPSCLEAPVAKCLRAVFAPNTPVWHDLSHTEGNFIVAMAANIIPEKEQMSVDPCCGVDA